MPNAVNKTSPDILSSGLDRLRGPKAKTFEQEKARLKKATKEFESFFNYQMLKTMRKTVPESPFAKNSPMSSGAGKETFSDIFDMEIARKMHGSDSRSISEMLYKSLEKLVESEYKAAETENVKIKDLRPPSEHFKKIETEDRPMEIKSGPIQIETEQRGPIDLMRQNSTSSAQDLIKKPKAP